MANTETTAPKRRIWLWGILAMMLTLLAAFLIQLFGPNPRIIVSKETTVITWPLRTDGLPDYQKYWLELGREGVTHENNGAVLFWQAIWPGHLDQQDWLPMAEALGFEQIPDSTNTLQDPYDQAIRNLLGFWLTQQYQADLTDEASDVLLSPENQEFILSQADQITSLAMKSPWTSEQIPPLADWVANNEKPLDLLIEASQRPKWWSPSPSLLGDRYEGAIAILLPGVQNLRVAGQAVCLRAMWHAGEGRREAAWKDLQACFQLARFCSEGNTLVEQLVAIAMNELTLNQTVVLLQEDEPKVKFARRLLDELMKVEVPCDLTKAVDQGDRLMYADLIFRLASGYEIGGHEKETLGLIGFLGIDWNIVLREGNEWHDRMTEIVQLSSRKERMIAVDEYDSDINELSNWVSSPAARAGVLTSRSKRSKAVSAIMISLMMPDLNSVLNRQDQSKTTLDLTRVAAALAVYRAEQGEYPEKLSQLVPGVLDKVPDDLYSGKPFLYERKSDGGYLLYSVFENGTDDGGTDFGGEIVDGEWLAEASEDVVDNESDIVIRVPMPKFELPAKPEFVQ